MPNVHETLKDREKVYGDYEGDLIFCHSILKLIQKRYLQVHGEAFSDSDNPELMLSIVNIIGKLSRIAVTPDHIDSWHDIQGYAKLTEELLRNRMKTNIRKEVNKV